MSKIQLRRGTAAEWTSADPTLSSGEIGFETDTNQLKIGDGSTIWSSLAYWGGGSGDMLAATYDPATIAEQLVGLTATQTLTNKTLTAPLGIVTNDVTESTDKNYVTDAEAVVIGNTSGTNTGDQDLSGKQDVLAEGAFVDGDKTKLDGIEAGAEVNTINSDVTGEPTGSDVISNIVSLTQAEYDAGTPVSGTTYIITDPKEDVVIPISFSDQTTVITTGTDKRVFYMPFAMTLTSVRGTLKTADNALFTIDINEGGTSILSTKLTIDSGEQTSQTAATAAVISDSALANWARITIDVDTAGTAAVGGDIYLIGKTV